MATARALLVDPDHALNYHLVSRCVRRSWLCGWDSIRRKDCTPRKDALEKRLFRLVRCFAVELHGFAIMSNHFHLVVRYDPLACHRWSAQEVAERWVAAIAPDSVLEDPQRRQARIDALIAEPDDIERLRQRLGSMSEVHSRPRKSCTQTLRTSCTRAPGYDFRCSLATPKVVPTSAWV